MKNGRFNRKTFLGALALLSCLLIIAVSSFVPVIIDPTRWQTTEFLSDELIIVAIVIFAMVSAIYIGQASNAQSDKSRIAKAKVGFIESVSLVRDRFAFGQWVKKVKQPNDIEAIKLRELTRVGLSDMALLDLTPSEIDALVLAPQKFDGRYYLQINKNQAKVIKQIKDGKFAPKLVEPEYYLTYSSFDGDRTITEKSGNEAKKKSAYIGFSVISKIVLTVIPAMIFASLVRDIASEQDTAEAWVKFASRVWAMATSCFMGYIVGCQTNDIDADYIIMRSQVHKEFSNDKAFKPMSEQEVAKTQFAERVANENRLYGRLLLENEKEG